MFSANNTVIHFRPVGCDGMKVNLFLCSVKHHTIKTETEWRAPDILDLVTGLMSVVMFVA
jgi:hypothetical protein